MPKLETRDMHPMFAMNGKDAQKIAAETVRRHARQQPAEASEKARSYALSLLASRDHGLAEKPLALALQAGSFVSARDCSQLIELLKPMPYKPRPAKQTAAPSPQVTDGFYMLDGDYVKVQEARNGSGRLYAKRWDGGSWEYEPGLVRKIAPEMALTAEQAKAWGKLYGNCIYCSLDLTDERSIDAGYGPKCAAKRGLPWG
jgi:hypothetical protein